jgi:hypothetical protein
VETRSAARERRQAWSVVRELIAEYVENGGRLQRPLLPTIAVVIQGRNGGALARERSDRVEQRFRLAHAARFAGQGDGVLRGAVNRVALEPVLVELERDAVGGQGAGPVVDPEVHVRRRGVAAVAEQADLPGPKTRSSTDGLRFCPSSNACLTGRTGGLSRYAKATAVHNPPSYRLWSYALSAVARSRLEGELGPYLWLWMREDHPGPGEKTSMRSPSGSKTKNA